MKIYRKKKGKTKHSWIVKSASLDGSMTVFHWVAQTKSITEKVVQAYSYAGGIEPVNITEEEVANIERSFEILLDCFGGCAPKFPLYELWEEAKKVGEK